MSEATLEIPLNVDLDNRPQTQLSYNTNNNSVFGIVGAVSINTFTDEGYECVRSPFQYVGTLVSGSPNGLFAATPGEQYTVEGSTVAYNGTNLSTTVTNTPYDFAASPLPRNIMIKNGTTAYYRNGATFAQIVDAAYPPTTVPGCACLNGTYYVMDYGSAIWGSSNLNDASAWSALNRINAWQDRSVPIRLIQHRSYIVALKASSMQVFYDAGNPVGSPLLPLLAAQQPVGCVESGTVQEIHGDHFWIAQMKDVGVVVVQMTNLQLKLVSTPAINRWLLAQYKLSHTTATFTSASFNILGHVFYALQPLSGGPMAVFDVTAQKWRFWHSPAGALSTIAYNTLCLNTSSSIFPDSLYQTPLGYFRFTDLPTGNNHVPVQDVPVLWYDTDSTGRKGPAIVQITTPIVDGGTMAEKTAMRLDVFSDNQGNGLLEVAWSDDDYCSWTPYAPLPLTEARAFMIDLGTFRRRAFRFRHIGATPLRLQRAVLSVLVGN